MAGEWSKRVAEALASWRGVCHVSRLFMAQAVVVLRILVVTRRHTGMQWCLAGPVLRTE